MKRVLFDLGWGTFRLIRKALYTLVPMRLYVLLGRVRGRLARRKAPPRVYRNIEITMPSHSPTEIEEIARAHEEHYGRLFLVRLLPHLPEFDDSRRWPVEGRRHVDAALERGRGAILVTAHFGYVRLVAPILRVHGYPAVSVVAGLSGRAREKRERERWLARSSELKRRIYQKTRVFTEPAGRHEILAGLDIRPVLDALSGNRCVMIVGDGVRAAQFVTLPLLGRPYPFPMGFMRIAMMTGAPVLPVFAVEEDSPGLARVEIQPPLGLDSTRTVEENLKHFASVLDRRIRKDPHLWCRWRMKDYFERAVEWSSRDMRERYTASFLR